MGAENWILVKTGIFNPSIKLPEDVFEEIDDREYAPGPTEIKIRFIIYDYHYRDVKLNSKKIESRESFCVNMIVKEPEIDKDQARRDAHLNEYQLILAGRFNNEAQRKRDLERWIPKEYNGILHNAFNMLCQLLNFGNSFFICN